MIVAGVDPGITGGLAFVDGATGALVEVLDMPVLVLKKAGKNSKVVDAHQLVGLLGRGIGHVFIEIQQCRPGQGVGAVAKTFENAGVIRGIVAALGIPTTFVQASVWKRRLGVPSAKDAARSRASELIPSGAVHWQRVRDDGRAEACLIALYGLRSLSAAAA